MTEFESNAISYLFTQVDAIGAHMVANAYHNIVMHYRSVIYTLTAVYIAFTFIKMQRGHYDANDFIMIVLRTVVILTLALNYNYFCLFIYDIVTNEPLALCKAMIVDKNMVGTGNITQALDGFINGGRDAASRIFTMGSWTNPTYLVFGIFVFVLVLITAAFAAALIVFSKCAATVLLGLSPVFIFFMLYDATKGLFESYVRQLITYALIPVMTCAILMILLSITNVAIATLNSNGKPTFVSLLPLGLSTIIQIYLLLQVKGNCAALSAGFSVSTVMSAFKPSSTASSGAENTPGQAGRWWGNAVSAGRTARAEISQRINRFNKA